MKMNKILGLLFLSLTMASARVDATENGGPVFLYDSSGNGLTSTTGALNVNFGVSTFGVTQSTTPWIDKDQADGSVTGGTAGSFSQLGGGIFNTSLPTLTNGQQAGVQVDSSGRLIIRPLTSGTDTVTVVGSGTFTVAQPTAANLNATVVGTVTSNAGTNLNTSLLQLDTTGAKLNNAQGSTTSGETGPLIQGAVTTAAPTYTTGQTSPISLTTGGAVRTDSSASVTPVSGTITAIPTDGVKSAYSVVMTNITPATSATDLFTIIGSGTKTVRIRNMVLYGSQTTGGVVAVSVIKRSTADTGGTSTTGTAIPWSSTDAAATAVVSAYTANPTVGTPVGTLSYDIPFIPIVKDTLFEYNFNLLPFQVYTLNSAAETIAINLNATTVTGGSLTLKISWTEE